MADYMAYWRSDQVRMALEDAADGQGIDHAASEQFLLVGRIEVAAVVGQREANRVLRERYGPDYDVYRASHHLLAIAGSEQPAREIPLDPVASRLRFVSPSPRDRLSIENGRVDAQQVRRLRELAPDTKDLFERLWREAGARGNRAATH
jgi:hypothetical protein